MKKLGFIFFFILSATNLTFAQKKAVTLEEIWGGAFRTEGLDEIRSLKNGTQYTVLNFDRAAKTTSVDIYDYASLAKVGTIVNSANLENIPYFTSYEFTADESKVLLATEVESIFRRSSLGIYYIYDVKTGKTIKISEDKIQEPTLSPDNSKVAYVFDNNIYIYDISKNSTAMVTKDGVKNKIINGVTDWVYEEEFAFVRAFDWNADGSKIAFLRFDETNVPEFSMDVYGAELYQTQQVFKYPKAGENNAMVSLHMLDVKSSEISKIALPSSYYIPRIKWMNRR